MSFPTITFSGEGFKTTNPRSFWKKVANRVEGDFRIV